MANYQYTTDIKADVLDRANEPTDGTSDFDSVCEDYINRAYQSIWTGGGELDPEIQEDWWWLRSTTPGILTLNPVVTTGTISVTNNSTTMTLSASNATSMAERHIKIDGHDDIFVISAHTAGTTGITSDSVYTGDTDTAATYKIMQLEYDLASDVLSVSAPMRVYQNTRSRIIGMELDSLERLWPLRSVDNGVPRNFAMIEEQKVRFSHYGGTSSTDLMRVDYDYKARPAVLAFSASEEPLVPWQYRKILADFGLMFMYQRKSDSGFEKAGLMAREGLMSMAKENRKRLGNFGQNFGHIAPRGRNNNASRGLLRTSSGLIIG